jgi:hypothetical protein
MKFSIIIGDLVCYKERYAENKKKQKYRIGLITSMTTCSLGRELTIFWNGGNITQTSVHLVRKIGGNENV